jgi:FMN phosphatase YigB (HAD superfamily)
MKNLIFLTLTILTFVVSTISTLPIICPEFNASKIRLITFDVFGALMKTSSDLTLSVKDAYPTLSKAIASQIAGDMLSFYASYMDNGGYIFNKSIHIPEPFIWVTRNGLEIALKNRYPTCENECLPSNKTFERLANYAWGNLTPYDDVISSLSQISYSNKYQIGVLSNGDDLTLGNATRQFETIGISIKRFGSDYPTGVFKPQKGIYQQVIDKGGYSIDEVLHVAGSEFDAIAAHTTVGFLSAVGRGGSGNSPDVCFYLSDLTLLPEILGLSSSSSPSPSPLPFSSSSPSPSTSSSFSPVPIEAKGSNDVLLLSQREQQILIIGTVGGVCIAVLFFLINRYCSRLQKTKAAFRLSKGGGIGELAKSKGEVIRADANPLSRFAII